MTFLKAKRSYNIFREWESGVSSIESGPKALNLVRINQKSDPDQGWIEEAFLKVYTAALRTCIHLLEELSEVGVSTYIGAERCNQISNGLILRLNGQVKICPGSSRPKHIYGNLWSEAGRLEPERIVEIWKHSPNQKHREVLNNWCPAKMTSLPRKLRREVLKELTLRAELPLCQVNTGR